MPNLRPRDGSGIRI